LTRNSTIATVPGAVSLAFAVIGIFAGAVKLELLAGEVMLTVGGTLPPLTVTLMAAEVVVRPPSSVALAVIVYGDALAATLGIVKL
jgi:hypothetical protein